MASIFHGVKPCRFQWKRWSIGGWYGPEGTILEEPTAWQVLQALLPLLQAPTAMLRGALGEKVISSDQEYFDTRFENGLGGMQFAIRG